MPMFHSCQTSNVHEKVSCDLAWNCKPSIVLYIMLKKIHFENFSLIQSIELWWYAVKMCCVLCDLLYVVIFSLILASKLPTVKHKLQSPPENEAFH